VLTEYTRSFLEHARSSASAVSVTAYCLWAFERGGEATHDAWFLATTIPFVLAILRFGLALERAPGSAPEDVFLRDRALVGLILVWLTLFTVAVALG
jgi:decaprenyl-phosphate phosphoribosyltransferase